MDYYNNDEHDEDDLPEVSLSMSNYARKMSNDDNNDEEDNDHSNRTLESKLIKFENIIFFLLKIGEIFMRQVFILYNPMKKNKDQLHKNNFILNHEHQLNNLQVKSIETFIEFLIYFIVERPDSPISESQIDTNTNKSKWEIRLPELLNSMVGPDRQVNKKKTMIHKFDLIISFRNVRFHDDIQLILSFNNLIHKIKT
jgi:hypothetical protein